MPGTKRTYSTAFPDTGPPKLTMKRSSTAATDDVTRPSLTRANTLPIADGEPATSSSRPKSVSTRSFIASRGRQSLTKNASSIVKGSLVSRLSGLKSGSIVGETTLHVALSLTKKVSSVKKTSVTSGLTKFAISKCGSKGSNLVNGGLSIDDVDEKEMAAAVESLKSKLPKTDTKSVFTKSASNASMAKSASKISLMKSASKVSTSESASKVSMSKSTSNASLSESASETLMSKSESVASKASLTRYPSRGSMSKSATSASLSKSAFKTSISKSTSNTSLASKAPLTRASSRASMARLSSVRLRTAAADESEAEESSAALPPSGLMELAISFDTTGSMYGCLEEVRAKIKDLVQRLQADIPGIRIAIIAHGDYCDVSNYVIKWIDFGASINELCDFVNNAERTSGGDGPECYELVLLRAREALSWTPGSKRALIVINDDVPHPPGYMYGGNYYHIDWRYECIVLFKMGVTVYGVQAGDEVPSHMFNHELALLTGGRHLKLQDFSSIFDFIMLISYREANPSMIPIYAEEMKARNTNKANRDVEKVAADFCATSYATTSDGLFGTPASYGMFAPPTSDGPFGTPIPGGMLDFLTSDEPFGNPGPGGMLDSHTSDGTFKPPGPGGMLAPPASERTFRTPGPGGMLAPPASERTIITPGLGGMHAPPASEGTFRTPGPGGMHAPPASGGTFKTSDSGGMLVNPASNGPFGTPGPDRMIVPPATDGKFTTPGPGMMSAPPASSKPFGTPASSWPFDISFPAGMLAPPASGGPLGTPTPLPSRLKRGLFFGDQVKVGRGTKKAVKKAERVNKRTGTTKKDKTAAGAKKAGANAAKGPTGAKAAKKGKMEEPKIDTVQKNLGYIWWNPTPTGGMTGGPIKLGKGPKKATKKAATGTKQKRTDMKGRVVAGDKKAEPKAAKRSKGANAEKKGKVKERKTSTVPKIFGTPSSGGMLYPPAARGPIGSPGNGGIFGTSAIGGILHPPASSGPFGGIFGTPTPAPGGMTGGPIKLVKGQKKVAIKAAMASKQKGTDKKGKVVTGKKKAEFKAAKRSKGAKAAKKGKVIEPTIGTLQKIFGNPFSGGMLHPPAASGLIGSPGYGGIFSTPALGGMLPPPASSGPFGGTYGYPNPAPSGMTGGPKKLVKGQKKVAIKAAKGSKQKETDKKGKVVTGKKKAEFKAAKGSKVAKAAKKRTVIEPTTGTLQKIFGTPFSGGMFHPPAASGLIASPGYGGIFSTPALGGMLPPSASSGPFGGTYGYPNLAPGGMTGGLFPGDKTKVGKGPKKAVKKVARGTKQKGTTKKGKTVEGSKKAAANAAKGPKGAKATKRGKVTEPGIYTDPKILGTSAPFGMLNPPASSGPFGIPASSGPFGTPASLRPFGTPSTSGPFGTPALNWPLGTPASSAPFGTPALNWPFGTPASSGPFGPPSSVGLSGTSAPIPGGMTGGLFSGDQIKADKGPKKVAKRAAKGTKQKGTDKRGKPVTGARKAEARAAKGPIGAKPMKKGKVKEAKIDTGTKLFSTPAPGRTLAPLGISWLFGTGVPGGAAPPAYGGPLGTPASIGLSGTSTRVPSGITGGLFSGGPIKVGKGPKKALKRAARGTKRAGTDKKGTTVAVVKKAEAKAAKRPQGTKAAKKRKAREPKIDTVPKLFSTPAPGRTLAPLGISWLFGTGVPGGTAPPAYGGPLGTPASIGLSGTSTRVPGGITGGLFSGGPVKVGKGPKKALKRAARGTKRAGTDKKGTTVAVVKKAEAKAAKRPKGTKAAKKRKAREPKIDTVPKVGEAKENAVKKAVRGTKRTGNDKKGKTATGTKKTAMKAVNGPKGTNAVKKGKEKEPKTGTVQKRELVPDAKLSVGKLKDLMWSKWVKAMFPVSATSKDTKDKKYITCRSHPTLRLKKLFDDDNTAPALYEFALTAPGKKAGTKHVVYFRKTVGRLSSRPLIGYLLQNANVRKEIDHCMIVGCSLWIRKALAKGKSKTLLTKKIDEAEKLIKSTYDYAWKKCNWRKEGGTMHHRQLSTNKDGGITLSHGDW